MHGFATINSTNVGDYGNRRLWVEVIQGSQHDHSGHHTLKVSYGRLGQTLQRIQRQGGKVIRIVAMPELELHPMMNSDGNSVSVESANTNGGEAQQTPVTTNKVGQETIDGHPPEKVHRGYKPSGKSSKPSRREKKSKHRR